MMLFSAASFSPTTRLVRLAAEASPAAEMKPDVGVVNMTSLVSEEVRSLETAELRVLSCQVGILVVSV